MGEKNHIGGKDTCNGAAGTDDGNYRGGVHQGLDYAGRKAGSKIENGKFHMPQNSFHIVGKDPEVEHVTT